MARTNNPAEPTLTGITDDAARGGLFAQSNTANPVSGIDVNGATVHDNNITLNLSITDASGVTHTSDVTFGSNPSTDQTLNFDGITLTPISGGGSGGTTEDHYIDRVNLSGTELQFFFNQALPDGTTSITRDLASIAGGATEQQIREWADEQIADAALVRTISVNNGADMMPDSTGNVDITIPQSGITLSDFEDSNTVDFETGTGNRITATANIAGVTTAGTQYGTALSVESGIMIDGRELHLNLNSGNIELALTDAPTPMGSSAVTPQPAPSNAFLPAPEEVFTVTATGGTYANAGDVSATSSVSNAPTGTTAPTPIVDLTPGATTAMVRIPAGTTNTVGDYEIDITATTTNADGMTETEMFTRDIIRFIPWFQDSNDIMSLSQGSIATSDAAWNGMITVISVAGNGALYFAVDSDEVGSTQTVRATGADGFPRVCVFRRSIDHTLADGTVVTFNVFLAPAMAGQTLTITAT